MPLDITFRLSDQDLDHFQTIVDKSKAAMEDHQDDDSILAAARHLIAGSKADNLPGFMVDRLSRLQIIIDMVEDREWQLNEEERKRVLGVLVYFCDPEDLIPDHTPGVGYIDDAIFLEIVFRELQAEIESYEEYCQYRSAEVARREESGQDLTVSRIDWLAEKRKTLQERMRRPGRRGGWRLRW